MKSNLYIIITLLTLQISSLYSQTWQAIIPSFSDTVGIYDTEIVNQNTAWFLGFKYNAEGTAQIARTTDDGKTFNVELLPLQGIPYAPCMASTDENTAYVMALQDWGNSVTLKTTDGGKDWIDTNTPWDPVFSWPDYIHAFPSGRICQIGDPRDGEFEIYISDDNAGSWNKISSSAIPDPLPGEFGYNNSGDYHNKDIWFGTNLGRLFHSSDEGNNWDVSQTPLTSGIGGLSFSDQNYGVISGFYGDTLQTELYHTEDSGKTWKELFLPISDTYHFYGVPCYIKGTSIIVASIYTDPQFFGLNQTWISFDHGIKWILYSDGEIIGWPTFYSNSIGWSGEWGPKSADGQLTKIYKYIGQPLTKNNSQIWEANDPGYPLPNLGCSSIDVVNNNVVWAAHAHYSVNDSLYGFFIDSLSRVSRTSDGGQTWKSGFVPIGNPAFVANITAIDANTAWICGIDGGGGGSKILKTENGGESWTLQSSAAWDPATSWVNFVHFWSPAKGITMGDPRDGEFEIYQTANGGQFWTKVNVAKIPDPLPGEFGYNNDFDIVGNTIWFGTNKGRIFRSLNSGTDWEVFESGLPDGAFDFGSNLVGIFYYVDFVKSQTTMRISKDGGTTWSDLNTIPENGNFRMNSLEFVTGSNVIIMTTINNSLTKGIFHTWISKDDGASWIQIDEGTNVNWMDFISPSVGWGGQPQMLNGPSYLFKYTGSVLSGLFENHSLNADVKIFPNPVNNVINLKIDSDTNGEYLVLINDINGKLLYKNTVKDLDQTNYTINIDFLISGLYTLTIADHDSMKTVKFIKQ